MIPWKCITHFDFRTERDSFLISKKEKGDTFFGEYFKIPYPVPERSRRASRLRSMTAESKGISAPLDDRGGERPDV
jgi:hypothetical protein